MNQRIPLPRWVVKRYPHLLQPIIDKTFTPRTQRHEYPYQALNVLGLHTYPSQQVVPRWSPLVSTRATRFLNIRGKIHERHRLPLHLVYVPPGEYYEGNPNPRGQVDILFRKDNIYYVSHKRIFVYFYHISSLPEMKVQLVPRSTLTPVPHKEQL